MDNVDIVLGYPWMDLMGTIDINVQKKFFELWYLKIKITLYDISLTKQEQLKEARGESLVGKIVEIPTNIVDKET